MFLARMDCAALFIVFDETEALIMQFIVSSKVID